MTKEKQTFEKLKTRFDILLSPGKDVQIEELAYLQKEILEEISTLKYGDFKRPPTLGERLADRVVELLGSWKFILIQACLLFTWILTNIFLIVEMQWDPYPFILLNLALSFQAAFTAPIIIMAQNRSNQNDRQRANDAYQSIEHMEQMFKILLERVLLKSGNENGNNA
jgi:uncharacterized membrane protein